MARMIIRILAALFFVGVVRGGGFCDPTPGYGDQWPPCHTP
jgi:hypothetical protein